MTLSINKITRYFLDHLPSKFKKGLGKVYDLYSLQATYFERYSQVNSPTCLIFSSGEKKPGCLTVGYDPHCDIKLEKENYIKLNIPDSSIDLIDINLFLERIDNDEYFWEFFREVGRLIKKDGKIKITYVDLAVASRQKVIRGEFWNLRRRFMYSKQASLFNSPLFYIGDCKRIIDFETLSKLAKLQGFEIVKKPPTNDTLVKSLIMTKRLSENNQWRLTNTLPKKGEVDQDIPVYLFDCDSSLILENFKNIELTKLQGRMFLSVIGSMFFLNLIPILKPNNIILFDINPFQVRYMRLITEIIRSSKNFNEFIENIFSRKFNKNVELFLSQVPNKFIGKRVREKVSDKEIYDYTLGKIRDGKYLKLDGNVPVLKIENNSMCQHITVINRELFKPGPRINVINMANGLARHYSYIKSKIQVAEIVQDGLESKRITSQLSPDSIIFVSNIGEEDWLNGSLSEFSPTELKDAARKENIMDSFERQWIDSVEGFKKFISASTSKVNFWVIDSTGNIFSKNELMLERSDSHEWLWEKVKSKIIGRSIEVIHKRKGTWGFKEHLNTINFKRFIRNREKFDTVILHILLGNGVSIDDFIKILARACECSKRIIILEHDRDSVNFGMLSSPNIVDIRTLLRIIRTNVVLQKSEIRIEWSGAGRRIDKNLYNDRQNYYRNVMVTMDL